MKNYWDTSALIEVFYDQGLRSSLSPSTDVTRQHSLTELFSTLTKGVNHRFSAQDACGMIDALAKDLSFVELTRDEVLDALRNARRLGVRGARIHDLMHARSAEKSGADTLFTLDAGGFSALAPDLSVRAP
jgi:hypothetical protein